MPAPERKPITPSLERHSMSAIFGSMPEGELKELKDDIKKNGLRDPVVLHEGKVLDGWHRYLCLCALGRPLNSRNSYDYDPIEDGASPEAYVYSKNLFRRQMPASQRVEMAASFLGYEHKSRGGTKEQRTEGVTMQQVAAAAGVSHKTAQRVLGKPAEKSPLTFEYWVKKRDKLKAELVEIEKRIYELHPPRGSRSRK